MMRHTTVFAILLTSVMGVALFYLKHEVTNLEDELNQLNHSIITEREAVHVLRAEWSHLNDMARLKDLSIRYLELGPTDPNQIKEARGLPKIQIIGDPDLEALVRP